MAQRRRAQMGQPKIHGHVAREADTVLLLYRRRRFETFIVQLAHGKKPGRSEDRLTVGARFTGRFYPWRCDLSPDGKHFVYFVMGGNQRGYEQQYYCWTAMCRPPALTAAFLLPHADTWGGGGAFLNDRTLIVNAGMHDERQTLEKLHLSEIDGVKVVVDSGYLQLKAPPKLPRPAGRGWEPVLALTFGLSGGVRRKPAKRAWLVAQRKPFSSTIGDYDMVEYALCRSGGAPILEEPMSRATWADIDRSGRLLLGIGHELWIYDKPREGMSESPNRIIDLEQLTEPD